jgi:hypothetical protein
MRLTAKKARYPAVSSANRLCIKKYEEVKKKMLIALITALISQIHITALISQIHITALISQIQGISALVLQHGWHEPHRHCGWYHNCWWHYGRHCGPWYWHCRWY